MPYKTNMKLSLSQNRLERFLLHFDHAKIYGSKEDALVAIASYRYKTATNNSLGSVVLHSPKSAPHGCV